MSRGRFGTWLPWVSTPLIVAMQVVPKVALIPLSVLGLLLYLVVNGLKRFVIPWHESVYSPDGVS